MRSNITTFSLFFAVSAATILACGGSQPPANPPTGDSTTADAGAATAPSPAADAGASASATPSAPPPAATPSAFDSLSDEKKVDVMVTKVTPNVGRVFKDFDGKKYAKFGCATCHGPSKGAKKEDPRKVLPKLTMSNGGAEKMMKAKPEMMKFMKEKVMPEMAAALGEKPYDPATNQGFGCKDCHSID